VTRFAFSTWSKPSCTPLQAAELVLRFVTRTLRCSSARSVSAPGRPRPTQMAALSQPICSQSARCGTPINLGSPSNCLRRGRRAFSTFQGLRSSKVHTCNANRWGAQPSDSPGRHRGTFSPESLLCYCLFGHVLLHYPPERTCIVGENSYPSLL
jgi:hypothetical protein